MSSLATGNGHDVMEVPFSTRAIVGRVFASPQCDEGFGPGSMNERREHVSL